jgi:hypothetical protein
MVVKCLHDRPALRACRGQEKGAGNAVTIKAAGMDPARTPDHEAI